MNPYEIKDINEREKILTELCEADREDLLARERLELLKKRFAPMKNKVRPDLFIQAWMNILIESGASSLFSTKKSKIRDLKKNLVQLQVLSEDGEAKASYSQAVKDEWADMAERLMDSYLKSGNYDRTLMGIMRIGESKLQEKIIKEIDTVTKDYPAKLGYEMICLAFREAVLAVYRRRTGLEA